MVTGRLTCKSEGRAQMVQICVARNPNFMNLLAFSALLIGGVALGAWTWSVPLRQSWRRQRLRRQAFPAEWRQTLRQFVPQVARLPADLQIQLKKHMLVFLAEKPFIGCNGLVVTPAMRVVVAAQACLLLLNRRADYFPALRQILLYPGPFWVQRARSEGSGVVHERREVLSGESWQQGQVILSWPDVLAGAADPADGQNVVVHEFAHQLDQQNGAANGAPWLGTLRQRRRWSRVMAAEYDALKKRLAHRDTDLIPPYAATDPAEFFAVATEVFFERGEELARERPALYEQLSGYFGVNPLSWT